MAEPAGHSPAVRRRLRGELHIPARADQLQGGGIRMASKLGLAAERLAPDAEMWSGEAVRRR
jgi:hypothetical protein